MSLKRIKASLAGLLCLALVACGGGGSSSGTPIGSNPDGVADVQIKFSATSVDNSGTQTNTATVTAIDGNGKGVSGIPLAIKVDSNATYTVAASTGNTTGSTGTVVALVTIGNDTTVRTVTMTASVGGITRTASFSVVGSKVVATDLTLTGPNIIANSVSNTITLTATAVDANRNALPNIPVTFQVDNGGVLIPGGTVTDSTGVVTGVLKIGADQSNRTITVTAVSGARTSKLEVQVTGAKLSASGVATTVAKGKTGNRIVYLLVDNSGNKLSGYTVNASASGAQVKSGKTDAAGEWVYTYDAPSADTTLVIAATVAGVTDTQTVTVGSTAVDPVTIAVRSASVAVSPNVVNVNAIGTTTVNKVEVRALFLSASNIPIKNVRVWFDLAGDKNGVGGTLDATAPGQLLYSDVNGVARTTYAPGTRFSPKDGVTVRACWSTTDFAIPAEGGSCPNAVTSTLTVISESLSVSIGTNGLLGTGSSGLTYVQRFAVQVVDSAGRAMVGVKISPSLDLLRYYKGFYLSNGSAWVRTGNGNVYPRSYGSGLPVPTAAVFPLLSTTGVVGECDNEDLNRNGVAENFLDSNEGVVVAEDQNNSGAVTPVRQILEPRKADVTVSVEGADTTDSSGIVVLKIEYPQNVASWGRFSLLVAASGVAGTEGRASYQADLAVLATAINNLLADPPFKISPYGTAATETYLRTNPEGQSGWLCTNPN